MSREKLSWVESAFDHPAFAALEAGPSFIVNVDPPGVLWANKAAASLFGAKDKDSLTSWILGARGGFSGALSHLARNVPAGGAPRLERLRVTIGRASRNLTLLCRRCQGPGEDVGLAMAVVGSNLLGSSVPAEWNEPADGFESASVALVSLRAEPAVSVLPDRQSEPAETPEADQGNPVELEQTRLRAAFNGAAHWRFLWRTDPAGLLVQIENGLFNRLGGSVQPALGQAFADCIAAFDPEAGERLRGALAGRRTWSGMRIFWPACGGRVLVPITLGASPQYEAGRQFGGFRGFGLIDLGSIEAAEFFRDEAGSSQAAMAPVPAPAGQATDALASAAEPSDPGPETADQQAGQGDEVPAVAPPGNVVRLRPLEAPAVGKTAADSDAGPGSSGSDAEAVNSASGSDTNGSLSFSEHFAFQEIARALGAKVDGGNTLLEDQDVPEPGQRLREPGPSVGLAQPTEAEVPATAMARPAEDTSVEPSGDAPQPEARDDLRTVRALLDAAGDAIAMIDEAGRILTLNRQGERWFGRDRRRLAGESFTLLLAAESRAMAASLLAEAKTQADAAVEVSRELVARTPEGTSMPLLMKLARVGEGLFSAVWRDLSTVRRLEKELADAQREAARASGQQPEFLAKVSHEIRTPLNAILGFAEIMMNERFGSLGNPRYKEYLQDIHASGTRVMSLVNDLLDLSRIEAGRIDLHLGSVEINKVIADCVGQMQPQAHRERVIIRTSLANGLPAVVADERSVRQIIDNLLSNAVKFNEPGGQVIVSTAINDAGAVVARIRDTGRGMSDDDIAAALEPFRQLAPSKQAGGMGLGLPVAKALVGANGASLSIRSRPREGTLVEVVFTPAMAPPARVPA